MGILSRNVTRRRFGPVKKVLLLSLMVVTGMLIHRAFFNSNPQGTLFEPYDKRIIGDEVRKFEDNEASELQEGAFANTSLVQIVEHRLYLYSTIQRNLSKLPHTDIIRHDLVVVAWRHRAIRSVAHRCCVWLNNGNILAVNVTDAVVRHPGSDYESMEFFCSFSHTSTVRAVSMIVELTQCPRTPGNYLVPFYPGPARPGLAVCSKISFWTQDAKFLVEWFEIVKFLGVDKVISYTYELNDDAVKVLQYYKSTGFADVFSLDFPDKGSKKISAPECRTEKAIVESDCAERMSNYQYASIMDKDEIIVPELDDNLQGSLLRFMDSKVREEPNLGMISFKSRLHNETGAPLPLGNTMYTDHYYRCSAPMFDGAKYIYLPPRIQKGYVQIHDARPLPGYSKKTASPQEAVIHHYRKARGLQFYISKETGINRLEPMVNCSLMQRLSEMVRQSTQRVRSQLGLVGKP